MRPIAVVALAIAVIVPVAAGDAAATRTVVPYPGSMAALGDSATLGFGLAGGDEDSWSTGSSPAVRSHYFRIRAAGGAVRRFNLAEPGAGFPEIRRQARRAIGKHVEYVTIWSGDQWCAAHSAEELKPLESEFEAVLNVLAQGIPKPRVFVASVQDPGAVFRAIKSHRAAVLEHNFRGVTIFCDLFISKNGSSSAAQVAAATERIARVNDTLAATCARYPQCRFDGRAVFRMHVAFADLLSDFIHPSLTGQRHLAAVTWGATFAFGR